MNIRREIIPQIKLKYFIFSLIILLSLVSRIGQEWSGYTHLNASLEANNAVASTSSSSENDQEPSEQLNIQGFHGVVSAGINWNPVSLFHSFSWAVKTYDYQFKNALKSIIFESQCIPSTFPAFRVLLTCTISPQAP